MASYYERSDSVAHHYHVIFELVFSSHVICFHRDYRRFGHFFHQAVELVNTSWLRFKPFLAFWLQFAFSLELIYCQVERWVWLQDVFWGIFFGGFVNLNMVSFSTLGGFVLIHTTPSHRSSVCSLHPRKPKCSMLSNQTVFATACGKLNPSTFFI